MSRPVRVLQVVSGLGMGGAETWLMEVLRRISASGQARMDFLLTGGRPEMFDEEARALGARLFYLPYGKARLPSFARGFRRILREGDYDVIHDHEAYIAGLHFLMGAGRLPPVRVAHVHNHAYQIANNYGVTPARRLTARMGKALLARFATHIVGASDEVVADYGFHEPAFARIPKGPLYCGFDTGRFLVDRAAARAAMLAEFGWPDDAVVALFVGRIDVSPDPAHPQANKNAGFAVDVAIAAARREPRLRLLLAGARSPAVPELEARISQAGLEGAVVFAGVRRDLEHLMAGADALLFPSRGEGLGLVAVEAQASGLPVLASTGVPRECAVVDEMVVFRDLAAGPDAWANDLLALAARPRDMPAANRAVAASAFAIDHSVEAMLDLYRSGPPC